MPRKSTAKPKDGLNDDQRTYVKHRAVGKSREESAIAIGRDYDKAGRDLEDSVAVQKALAEQKQKFAEEGGVTRHEIIELIRDAINMGRILADPLAMIRGATELAKITGNYEPPRKNPTDALRGELVKRIENMPDDELYRLAKGRVIDAEPEPAQQLPAPDAGTAS